MPKTKNRNGAAKRKPAPPKKRLPWFADRWTSAEQAERAAEDFLRAAHKLIVPGRSWPNEWSEAEALAIRIATQLQCLFQGVPSASTLAALRRADAAFKSDRTLQEVRLDCVASIAHHATKCRTEWKDDPENRRHALRAVVHNWAAMDEGLRRVFPLPVVTTDDDGRAIESYPRRLDRVARLIDEYDPDPSKKRPGTQGKSAERILAEIVVLRAKCRALGFDAMVGKHESDEDRIDAVRVALAGDVSKLFSAHESA